MSSSNKNRVTMAAGPLVTSAANPRYFAIASDGEETGQAVYLTGSHIWNNFHDGMGPGSNCAETPEPFDFDAYIQFLKNHHHNFIRLWRWEQFKSQAADGNYHLCMEPQPWQRTGPGLAADSKPKFDLTKFEPAYFERLRKYVTAAGKEEIYVAVMLFDGWALHLSPVPDNVRGHPFHAENNINGISITSILDYQVLPLDPRVQALQEAYIQQVVDTVQDLPNVLYEVANESSGGGTTDEDFAAMLGMPQAPEWGDSTQWQYWVIDVVKRYEQRRGYVRHPIGMTMQFPVPDQTKVNHPLFASIADWISPGFDDEIFKDGQVPMMPGNPPSHWLDNPPANDGAKVIITDTDHYAPGQGDALWAWKSFLRGLHPILMDFGIIDGVNPPANASGDSAYEAFEPVRDAMGDTLRFAERMNLIDMTPRGELSSTGYALTNPGKEYLVLQPNETGEMFTVQLTGGNYLVEWFNINNRESKQDSLQTVEGEQQVTFKVPFSEPGPAVLYLRRAGYE